MQVVNGWQEVDRPGPFLGTAEVAVVDGQIEFEVDTVSVGVGRLLREGPEDAIVRYNPELFQEREIAWINHHPA